MKPAVFLDRDGTVNEQMGYINHISRFILLPGVAKAISLLNRHDYLTIIISNQSGIARGYFPFDLTVQVHNHMKRLLAQKKAFIDEVFFCPHHPKGTVQEFSIKCDCRKPKTGLIKRACENFDIDMQNSYVIGDRCIDIEMAHRAGLGGILVTTGYGLGEIEYVLPQMDIKPIHIAKDLLNAVLWIIANR
jgi:D-glycero-D-manno-heptose 1,7-bisphosphate phosphatase